MKEKEQKRSLDRPHNAEKYAYRVIWSEEDQEHVGLVTEFPSLSWLAATPGEALNGITKLVSEVLTDLATTGEEVPEPLSKREFNGKIQVRVPPSQHRELVMEAADQGVSMNRLISQKLSR
ncbi:MAG TPA: toxin-antitoxin system HicB family antitoxin [Kofleriaceae bacterium]|jgi:predicted HicB family RNase H-like nuclease